MYGPSNSTFLLFSISTLDRQFRHFLFRIGSYETDHSAISLRVAAKTKTKKRIATDLPPRGKREKKMPKWRLPKRNTRNHFAKQTRALLSWPICLSIDLMLIITLLETNTKTLSRPIPTAHSPPRLEWVETKQPAATTLREDSCVIKVSAIHAKYADILEKETTKLLSWRIYISINFMVTTSLTSRTTGRPKRHLEKKKMAIRNLFAKQTPKVNCYRGHGRCTVYNT